jgi:CRP-like cAMP-binding protein
MLQTETRRRSGAVDAMVVRNRLLESLPPDDFDALRDHLEPIDLRKGAIIQDANRPAEYAIFIETGVVSVVARTVMDGAVEILTVGDDGLIGIAAILGGGVTVQRACVHIAGQGLRIGADNLASAILKRPKIRERLMRYLPSLILKQSQTALCNAKHSTEQKVTRWLLQAQDYAGCDVLPVTHDLLAGLLNARRAGVTQILSKLDDEGVVARSRGLIRIRNRALMQSRSCSCYKTISSSMNWLDEFESFHHRLSGD